MQLRDLARLTTPIASHAAGTIGRVVGRRFDETSYIIELSADNRIEVAAWQVESADRKEPEPAIVH